MDKYELLPGEDLGLKPSTTEQTKFENSPLGKIFNKGLSEDDKKEGLFKRLEKNKDKNDDKNEKLINTLITTNKAPKNKINNQSKKLIYDVIIIYITVLQSLEILTILKNHHSILCLT